MLKLSQSAYVSLRQHGEETYPHECCGALLGRVTAEGWAVTAAIQAGNARTDAPHNRYSIAPAELVKIARAARRQGVEIAGFYHSHPDHPPQWSATDLTEAHWLGCSYVITEVARGKAAATHAFLLAGDREEEKHFERETIQLDDGPIGPSRP